MKKVLLASTALTVMSTAAYADITLSGSAEIGVADNGLNPDVQFFQDVDITFSLSSESDAGFSFGAAVDLDENDINATETDDHGTTIFVSGDFGTITMGDTDGAFDWAMTEVNGAGSIADDETAHAGFYGNSSLDGDWVLFSGNDGQILRYDHSIGDFAFAVSYAQDVDSEGLTTGGGAVNPATGSGDAIGFGVKGTFGDIGVGLAYTENNYVDIAGVSVSANLGDITAVVNYSQHSLSSSAPVVPGFGPTANADVDHMAIGVTYTMGATTLHANWGEFSVDGGPSNDGVGLAANYDLGGGATFMVGYGDGTDNILGSGSKTTWSAGLSLSF